MIPHIRDFLQVHHPFDQLAPEARATIEQAVRRRTFAPGEVILQPGDRPSACLFIVAAGSARLARNDLDDGRVLEEGDCFGFPSIISGLGPTATVTAEAELTCHCVPASVFRDLLQEPAFAEFFLKDLGERLRQAVGGTAGSLGGELTTPVGELGLRPLVRIAPDATVAEAARAMRSAGEDVVLVDTDPPGILTDHDFQTKVLAEDRGPDTPVGDVMTRDLKTLAADTPVHSALLFMLEEGIHHLPVTREGELAGLVSATDLLRHQTRNPLYLSRQLENLDDPANLASYSTHVAAMVERLFAGGLKVAQVGRICSSLNDTLVRRLARLVEQELGTPPCPWAWLVFGSEGRQEQTLITDQDNALVYAEPGTDNAAYFADVARRMADHLATAGFPPCPGGYMAVNWSRDHGAWLDTMRGWIGTPDPESLMMVGIFFDFRAVAGGLDVSALEEVVTTARDNQIFMAHLARQSLGFRPPLNFFRRIQADDGRVDLKTGGIAPITAAGRVLGIAAGTRKRPTRERYEAAIDAGLLGEDLGRTVIETYRFLLGLRLEHQLGALRAGEEPDNRVRLKDLSSRDNRHLKDAFGVIRELQEKVAHRFRVSMLG